MKKTWDGDLSDLSVEEMEWFKWFYRHFEYGIYDQLQVNTKKKVKEIIQRWKEGGWMKNVLDIAEFMFYERIERHKREKIKYEKVLYRKLKRKYG